MAKGKLRSMFDLNLTQPGTYRVAVVNEGVFARWKDKAKRPGQARARHARQHRRRRFRRMPRRWKSRSPPAASRPS